MTDPSPTTPAPPAAPDRTASTPPAPTPPAPATPGPPTGVPAGARFMLTAGGLGLLRPAPGTWGSLPPVVLALALTLLIGGHWTVDASLVALAAVASVACVRFGGAAEQLFGRKDPSAVVADEVAGQCVALLFLPWLAPGEPGALLWNGCLAVGGFLAFRLLDILKPPPARSIERLAGGLGILMDDLIAGLYALALMQVAVRLVLPQLL